MPPGKHDSGRDGPLGYYLEVFSAGYQRAVGGTVELLEAATGVTSATDLLWTLNHPETWYLLVRQCGWTADRYEQWVAVTLSAQMLGV